MKLGLYYIDLNKCLGEDFSEYEFDEQGIPLTRFHRQPEWKHNPITVSQYGLHHFNRYLRTNSSESRDIFLNQAKWLVDHGREGANNSLTWHYLFDLPFYDIQSPWISGMAQGQAISVLLRAHQLSGDSRYEKVARSAWRIFQVPVAQGGVIGEFPDGNPVIEEYPSPKLFSCVLNGCIFGLFGLYDYSVYTEENMADAMFLNLVNSLKQNLYRYDSGYWSYYDLKEPRRLTSKAYHRIHIEQLKALATISGEAIFKEYHQRWKNYSFSVKSNFKWIMKKIGQKVFMRI